MMFERVCIDWSRPVLNGVADWLLSASGQRLDLSSWLVIVPTQQAGRRLREALALHASREESALLPPLVRTPSAWGDHSAGGAPVAGSLLAQATWCRILLDMDPAAFPGLFPKAPASRDVAWAARLTDMIQRVRSQLVEGGYLIRDVVAQYGPELEELERWQDLQALEELYLDRLAAIGLQDRCERQVVQTESAELPGHIKQVAIAAVPDPSLLMIRAMRNIALDHPVHVLVHCDPDDLDAFDEWGRPLSHVWRDRHIPVCNPAADIRLGTYPLDQARMVTEAIGGMEESLGPADIAIGVPDASVAPFIEDQLAALGLVAFNPAGQPVNQHRAFHAMDAARHLLKNSVPYRQVSQFIRHPDVLAALSADAGVEPARVLAEVDDLQNRVLPQTWDDMKRFLESTGSYPAWAAACTFIERIRACRLANSPEEALAQLATLLYQHEQVDPQTPAGESFQAVAGCFQRAIRETRQPAYQALNLAMDDSLELMLRALSAESFYEDRPDAQVDLEGWLELHWNDAPLLIVTGMNDGLVPDTQVSDVFLPDSLLRQLALRSDETRLTRDAYLMSAMLASRQAAGRVVFIAGAMGRSGDPLRPSRLLFRCPDEELPQRTGMLFSDASPASRVEPASISFKLDAQVGPPPQALRSIGVTALGSYLRCPYRFYLQYVQRLTAAADDAVELDAMQLGNLAHEALYGLKHHPECLRNAAAMRDLFSEDADAWVAKELGSDPPLPVRVQVEAIKKRLFAMAEHQAMWAAAGWMPFEFEEPCVLTIGGLALRGKLDRVDRHEETGALRIIDFKTRDRRTTMSQVHFGPVRDATPAYAVATLQDGKTRAWQDLQLPIYVRMLRSRFPDASIEAGIGHLPKAVSETGWEAWDELSEDLLGSAWDCAVGIVGDIEAGRFWPPAEKMQYESDFDILFPFAPAECLDPAAFMRGQPGGGVGDPS